MWDYDLTNEDDPMGDAIIETRHLRDAAVQAAGAGGKTPGAGSEHAILRGWDFDLPLILNGASSLSWSCLFLVFV